MKVLIATCTLLAAATLAPFASAGNIEKKPVAPHIAPWNA